MQMRFPEHLKVCSHCESLCECCCPCLFTQFYNTLHVDPSDHSKALDTTSLASGMTVKRVRQSAMKLTVSRELEEAAAGHGA